MRESDIERYLVDAARRRGGVALKWVSPGNAGVPDRLVFLPGGAVGALELKAPGEVLRPLQVEWQTRLTRLGVPVGWASSRAGVDAFLGALRRP